MEKRMQTKTLRLREAVPYGWLPKPACLFFPSNGKQPVGYLKKKKDFVLPLRPTARHPKSRAKRE